MSYPARAEGLVNSINSRSCFTYMYAEGHLPPISQIIQVRRKRHTGHCRRSNDKPLSNVLLCTATHGHTSVGQIVKIYSSDWRLEDLRSAMADKDG